MNVHELGAAPLWGGGNQTDVFLSDGVRNNNSSFTLVHCPSGDNSCVSPQDSSFLNGQGTCSELSQLELSCYKGTTLMAAETVAMLSVILFVCLKLGDLGR
jgi:hypothetical protein